MIVAYGNPAIDTSQKHAGSDLILNFNSDLKELRELIDRLFVFLMPKV